jgi:hypothetical protein
LVRFCGDSAFESIMRFMTCITAREAVWSGDEG